jgi:hypothetical protein
MPATSTSTLSTRSSASDGEHVFLYTHPDVTGNSGELTHLEWVGMAQLFMAVMRAIRPLKRALDEAAQADIGACPRDTFTCDLDQVFAAWIRMDNRLSSEGKTKSDRENISTAWCWDDWLCLQSLAKQVLKWSGCPACADQEPAGERMVAHLTICRGIRWPPRSPKSPKSLKEQVDIIRRSIQNIRMFQDWIPRSGILLGYNPCSNPPRLHLRYEGVRRMQRGSHSADLADVDASFALNKKLYLLHADASTFDMTSATTRSCIHSGCQEERDESGNSGLGPLLDQMSSFRRDYGITLNQEDSFYMQLASSPGFEEFGPVQADVLSIFRRESYYADYQTQLDHYFEPAEDYRDLP